MYLINAFRNRLVLLFYVPPRSRLSRQLAVWIFRTMTVTSLITPALCAFLRTDRYLQRRSRRLRTLMFCGLPIFVMRQFDQCGSIIAR